MPTEIELFEMLRPGKRLPTGKPLPPAEAFRADVIEFIAKIDDREGGVPGYQRASSFNKVCGRRTALAALHPHVAVAKRITAGRRINFDVGKALHYWWQNKYLGPMQRLWGQWFCMSCKHVHTGLMPRNCPGCGETRVKIFSWSDADGKPQSHKVDNITYAEMLLLVDDLAYSGHPDGLLVEFNGSTEPPTMLNELKSISTKNYDKLKKPESGYLDQIHAYMNALGMRTCLITYIDKGKSCEWRGGPSGPVAGSPRFKNFYIEFDDERWAGLQAKLLDNKRAIDEPPETSADVAQWDRVCDGPGVRLACECPLRDECFALRVKP